MKKRGGTAHRRAGLLAAAASLLVAQQAMAQTPPPPEEAPAPEPPPPPEAAPPPETAPPPRTGDEAEPEEEPKTRLEIYGFAMLDMGYNFGRTDPDWFDVLRPTKLPAFPGEFGESGQWFMGVRQSRFGVKSWLPTPLGELKTIFEFELFGVGVDAGQTTFRLRQAWGELWQIGAGQTWSPFMDPDVFPNSIEYWGPSGMVFFRNVQLRWTPWQNEGSNAMIALERPGGSRDPGIYENRVELEGIAARLPLPDLSGHVRLGGEWGHVQLAGIVRRVIWVDTNQDQFDLSGSAVGWGVNASSNLKILRHVLLLQVVYGRGIENYMNDAPVDIGIENQFDNPVTPVRGVPLPVLGVVAFLNLNWSDFVTSTVGYSLVNIQNSDAQTDDAFKRGQYALANILFYPVPNFMLGPEVQWGRRQNFRDGYSFDDVRIQFSAKYSFGLELGGKK